MVFLITTETALHTYNEMNLCDRWREAPGKKAVSGEPTSPLCVLVSQDRIITDLHPTPMEKRGKFYIGGGVWHYFAENDTKQFSCNGSNVRSESMLGKMSSASPRGLKPHMIPVETTGPQRCLCFCISVLLAACWGLHGGGVSHTQRFHVPIPGALCCASSPESILALQNKPSTPGW